MTTYALRVTSLEKGWTIDFKPDRLTFVDGAAAERWALGFQRALGGGYRCALVANGGTNSTSLAVLMPAECGVSSDLFGGAA